jgi:hypothetical protein
MKQLLKIYFFMVIAGIFFSACDKLAPEEEFLADGEKIYTGRPEGVTSFSGRERIKLQWYLVSDPKISKVVITWNNPSAPAGTTPVPGARTPGKDSLILNIHRIPGMQLVETNIDRLIEGVYNFTIYTYDKEGHKSVKTEVIAEAYASTYENSISNRPIDSAEYDAAKKQVRVKWFGVAQQAVVIDAEYTDNNGVLRNKKIVKVATAGNTPVFLGRDTLINYKSGTTFKYRTGFLPTATSLDTVYTDFKVVTPTLYVPPPPPPPVSNLAIGTKVTASSSATQALTDGSQANTNKWQPSGDDRADLNVWFYIDLGAAKDINETRLYFTNHKDRITYYEVLTTDAAIVDTKTKWKRAFIKLEAPEAEDIQTFNKVKARYVKVNIGTKDEGTNVNVSEIEVYNQ